MTKHSRISDAERQQIVELYKPPNGLSMRAIGEQLRRSYGSVNRVLQAAGVDIRRRGGNRDADAQQ
jgi:IS30 family transposase